jgi:hypothetical protein
MAATRNFGRYAVLLTALLSMLILTPFLVEAPFGVPRLHLLFSIVLVAGIYAVSRRRTTLWVGVALAVPALLTEWLHATQPAAVLAGINYTVTAAFMMFIAAVILYDLLDQDRVTADTIFGGITIYLLIGILWVVLYSAVEFNEPGSFLMPGGSAEGGLLEHNALRAPRLFYFSFVTLTTLGYGDVAPLSERAQALAVGEAIVGQLYIAIFIARLVGLHLWHQRTRSDGGGS